MLAAQRQARHGYVRPRNAPPVAHTRVWFTVTLDLRFLHTNKAFQDLMGLSEASLERRSAQTVMRPGENLCEAEPELSQACTEALTHPGQRYHWQTWSRINGGHRAWLTGTVHIEALYATTGPLTVWVFEADVMEIEFMSSFAADLIEIDSRQVADLEDLTVEINGRVHDGQGLLPGMPVARKARKQRRRKLDDLEDTLRRIHKSFAKIVTEPDDRLGGDGSWRTGTVSLKRIAHDLDVALNTLAPRLQEHWGASDEDPRDILRRLYSDWEAAQATSDT